MIYPSRDPIDDFHREEDEQAEFEKYCPVCAICGERITDDTFRRIGRDCYHDECIETVQTDSYVEGVRYGY